MLERLQQPSCFGRKLNAAALTKSKRTDVFVEVLGAHAFAYTDRADVA